MFLYLIELYFAGILLFHLLSNKLPSAVQAVSGILMGYLLYVLNAMVMIGVGIGLSQTSVVILTSVECLVFIIVLSLKRKLASLLRKILSPGFLIVGIVYFGLLFLFYELNLSFITNDSLFLILFGQDLIQSGFSEWYFASPASMGIYMALIQAMGMLFGLDYIWFIQPVLSVILIAAIVYFGYKSVSPHIVKRWVALLLVVGAMLLLMTTNLAYIMTIYIHTNLTSGLFLFLTIVSLYFAIEEKDEAWLVLCGLSLVSFGLMRIENVLIALLTIFFYISNSKLSRRQAILTFVPYLLIQGIWFFFVSFMDINTFLSSMSNGQVLVISIGCFAMIILLILRDWQFMRWILEWAGKLLPFLLLVVWSVLGILNPRSYSINLNSISSNLFVSGNWGFLWYAVIALFAISLFSRGFPQKGILLRIMVSFFATIEILGFFRLPYHARWFDSSNRMMIHIAPLILFFLITQIAKANSFSSALPEGDKMGDSA